MVTKELKRQKVKIKISENFCALVLIAAVVSALGFFVENVWLLLNMGRIDNRNMCLPLLFGYGLSMLAVYFLFGTPREPRFILKAMHIDNVTARRVTFYLLVFFCVCAGESLIGYTVEAACGFQWWNYENLPFNIGTYTSIPTSMVFALMIYIFMEYIFKRLYKFFISVDPVILKSVSIVLLLLMSLDFINSGIYMFTKKKMLNKWKVQIFEKGVLYLPFLK